MTHAAGHLIQLESRLQLQSKLPRTAHKPEFNIYVTQLRVTRGDGPGSTRTTSWPAFTSKNAPTKRTAFVMIKSCITRKCPSVNLIKRHNVKNPIIHCRCKVKVLEGGVFLSLIEMLRLTITWVDSFYWNCYQYGLNSIYPQSLCSTPCTINLILSPAQRRAADDVMMPLSANYITGQLPLIYRLFKTITNIHWGHQGQCHKPSLLNKCIVLQPCFECIFCIRFLLANCTSVVSSFGVEWQ